MAQSVKRRKVDFKEVITRGFLTEQNVGVTEFIGKQKPYIGILKHRFEDFVVHEINKNDEVVKLETLEEPENVEKEEDDKVPTVSVDDVKLDENVLADIKNYSTNHSSMEPVLISIEEMNKEDRTTVHNFIRQNYSDLESKTETIDGKKYIKIVYQPANSNSFKRQPRNNLNGGRNAKNQNRLRWPKDKPNYVHFVLYKENVETVQVVNELSRRLACTPKNFTFAGTKDKRAITTQMFSAWKTSPHLIWKATNDINRRNGFKIRVGHFDFFPEQLKLGDLNGNQFEIVLRNVRLVDDLDKIQLSELGDELKVNVEDSLKTLKDVGFINYFGMQRFGSHRIDSHKLGILILKKDFKQLVHEILVEKPKDIRPYNNQNEVSFNDAIRIWRETGDAGLAYKKLNYKYSIEGSLLRALARVSPNDWHGALCIGLLRNSRLLYLHAYQSYLWNQIASYRIREFGLQLMEGDLVFVGPDFVDASELIEATDEISADATETEEVVDETENSEKEADKQIKANIPSDQIILVTKENINQFTIYDLVLPIVGGLSKLPQNKTTDFINKILKEDGISIDDFAALSKQWCVNGSYRKLITRPNNLSWQWLTYQDDTKPLIETDMDRIRQRNKNKNGMSANGKTNDHAEEEEDESKSRIALKLTFTLPTSCYATVMLREITKLSSLSLENKPWQQPYIDEENQQDSKDDNDEKKKNNDEVQPEVGKDANNQIAIESK